MAAGAKPRVFTFLSAASAEEKQGVLVNLAASLVRVGSDVLLLDACNGAHGIGTRLDVTTGASLLEVVRRERPFEQAVRTTAQNFQFAALTRGIAPDSSDRAGLAEAFSRLRQCADVLIVDAEIGRAHV